MADVTHLIENVCQLMREDLKSKGIEVHKEVNPSNLEILCDPDQVTMILINLVKNASESLLNQADRQICIRAIGQGDLGSVIKVEDNGPGIIPEALERILFLFTPPKKPDRE